MDYTLAITAGYSSLIIVGLAAAYYPLSLLLDRRLRADIPPAGYDRLRLAVAIARFSHPFIASLISMAAAYHVYVMWFTYPAGLKVATGILVSSGVVLMANTGWALKFRPNGGRLRRAHRLGMYVLLALLAVHIFS